MGIREEKGFKAKREEARRQFDNATRTAHTRIRETSFLWTKKDTTPKGSKKVDKFQTLSDFEKELDRLKGTAPTRPPERVSKEREDTIKKLIPERIKKYIDRYKEVTIDNLASEIDKLGKKLESSRKNWDNSKIKKCERRIIRRKLAISIKKLVSEKSILEKQNEDLAQRVKSIRKLRLTLKAKIDKGELLDILRTFDWRKPLSPQELVKKSEKQITYFYGKILNREIRIEEIDELLRQEIPDKGQEKVNEPIEKVNEPIEEKIEYTKQGEEIHNKIKSIENELKVVNNAFMECKDYLVENNSKLHKLDYLTLRKIKGNTNAILAIKHRSVQYKSLIENCNMELKKSGKEINNISNSENSNEISILQNVLKKAYDQLNNVEEHINSPEINILELQKLSSEITKQECIQIGRNALEITSHKTTERTVKGMTKDVINISLEKFYHFSTPKKLNPEKAKEEITAMTAINQLLKEWSEDVYDNLFYIESWPKAPSDPESVNHNLLDKVPYQAYVNPKKGFMIVTDVFRDKDQDWRDNQWDNINLPEQFPEEWKLESVLNDLNIHSFPKEFFMALHASDISAELYKQVVDRYVEDINKELLQSHSPDTYFQLPKSDASHFPCRELIGSHVIDETTKAVASNYANKQGELTIFRKENEDEGFFAILGTPVAQIKAFMLAQNPEKVGGGKFREVTCIEAICTIASLSIKYKFTEK